MTPHALTIADALLRLALAFVLALPLGWDREQKARSAGLRAYPLLSAGACGFLLLPQGTGWGAGEQADVFYGVLGGIGFAGSGAVLKSRERVRGLTTAVSLWAAGAIGAGVACGATHVSAALAVLGVVALHPPGVLTARGRGAR